ncbi:MAG: cytochrome c oxidase subunit II [Acidimicrobiales bacterium]
MRRNRRLAALSASLLVLLAACAENAPQDTLEPQGPVAREIDRLIDPVFIVAGVVFVLVQALVVIAVIKFRAKPDSPEPEQIHGNTRLEVGWTLAPALILLAVAVPTIATIFDLAKRPENPVKVTVIGHQFWWEYRYDDLGIVTANELHMPTGRDVELTLEAVDVIHSFWVPKLAGKTDVIPGRTNRMKLIADKPGTYLGQCAEFCGTSHANMRLTAVAQTPAEFDTWVRNQRALAPEPAAGTPAADGKALFTAKGCAGCHTVEGVSRGQLGPNLTHLHSRSTFAGGIFDMTPERLRAWLRNPPEEKPGAKMPDLGLTADDITKLLAYLETLQ